MESLQSILQYTNITYERCIDIENIIYSYFIRLLNLNGNIWQYIQLKPEQAAHYQYYPMIVKGKRTK